MALSIRELGIADRVMVEELLDVFSTGWADPMAPSASGPMAFIADPASFMFGAYDDNEPVGFAWGVHMRYPAGRVATYLHQLDVVEAHRRRGIGTMLVEASIALARRMGHQKFWLSTGGHNEVAQALYDSLGGGRKPKGDVNYWWDLTAG